MNKPPPWKVGELAKRTGMSVRALHHYDDIGLLVPALRTASGHRLYDRHDIERLQQIQSLRLMGISLEEVKRLIDGPAVSPRQLIDVHLARVHEQIAMHARLAERLTALAIHLDSAHGASIEDLCSIIEAMTTMEQYFTTEQLDTLRDRRTRISPEHMREVQDAWAEIIPAVRQAMDAGTDPASPGVLALARRWKALVTEFTGGDAAIGKAVMTMYQHEGPALEEKLGHVPTPDMFEYIGKAMKAL
ncbi:MAG: MerR family transcriptional regulator [Gemmatimonadaceae bacterium]